MTVSNADNNLDSLISKIEQIETQQDIWKKNTIWLKRCFDEFKQDFDKLAELSQVESNQEKILQLSAQIDELKQFLNQSSDVIVENQEVIEKIDIDDVEQENHLVQEDNNDEIISGEEFWERYEEGERDFKGINLTGADLTGNSPSDVNLSKANLTQTRLSDANWSSENLSGANLTQADLNNINLCNANLKEAILDDAFLCQAELSSVDLYKASLKGANLTEADINNANLNEANLSEADLSQANLNESKLIRANLTNANLTKAKLVKANLKGAKLDWANLEQALYTTETIFPTNFNPIEANACLIASGACLEQADLSGVDLIDFDLSGANLEKANLSSANLYGADLSQANLSGAEQISAVLEVEIQPI